MKYSELSARERAIYIFLMVCLFIFIGFVFANQYFSDKQMADASLGWTKTRGKIESSGIEAGSGLNAKYAPQIRYSYTSQGKNFEGSAISFPNPQFPHETDANAFIAKYPVYGDVAISFDPKNPAYSCLVTGETRSLDDDLQIIRVLIAAGILCYSLPIVLLSRRRRVVSNPLDTIEPPSKRHHNSL